MFVFGIILLVFAAAAFIVGLRTQVSETTSYGQTTSRGKLTKLIFKLVAAVLALIAIIVLVSSMVYAQSRGEASVIRSFTGEIKGDAVTTTGLHTKAPWDERIVFNTLNQTVTYINAANGDESDNNGGKRTGPYITTQDKNGVSFNLSLTVRYSLDAGQVKSIYSKFKDEDNFKTTFVNQDVRSVTRKAPNQFTTIQMLTDQGAVETAIEKALAAKWKGTGVSVDSVALQEPQAPKSVTESYAKVAQAQNALQAAQIDAQQTVAKAQAQADANKILNSQPLTDKSLNQKYIEALKSGTIYVVPEGSTPLITTGK